MEKCDSLVRGTILHMRSLRDEPNGSKACNDADSCAIVRTGVRDIYLAAPFAAQARAQVQTGLLPRLEPDLVAPLHRDAVEVPAHPTRCAGQACHSLHDHLSCLCPMGG